MHNLHELYFKTDAQFSFPLEVKYIVKESTKFYLEKMGFYRNKNVLNLDYTYSHLVKYANCEIYHIKV